MYIVKEARERAGKRSASVTYHGRFVGGASLPFIQWMTGVPRHQLDPAQIALVEWYAKRQPW